MSFMLFEVTFTFSSGICVYLGANRCFTMQMILMFMMLLPFLINPEHCNSSVLMNFYSSRKLSHVRLSY